MKTETAVLLFGASPKLSFLLWLTERLHVRITGERCFDFGYIRKESAIDIDVTISQLGESNGVISDIEADCVKKVKEVYSQFSENALKLLSTFFPEIERKKEGESIDIKDFFRSAKTSVIHQKIFRQDPFELGKNYVKFCGLPAEYGENLSIHDVLN